MTQTIIPRNPPKGGKAKRRFVGLVGGFLLAVASLVAVATPAQAAVTVTVRYGDWQCSSGGSVGAVLVSIDRGGQTTNWVPGRAVTLWSNTGQVQINGSIFCNRPWYQGGSYYRYNLYFITWVNSNGQGIWI